MNLRKVVSTLFLGLAVAAPISHASDKAGAFVGGLLAGKILNNMSEQTQAEKQQAYYAQQQAQYRQVPQAAPAAAPAQQTPQQRLDQLDKLAAGGYITPEEYKAKKQQILDSM